MKKIFVLFLMVFLGISCSFAQSKSIFYIDNKIVDKTKCGEFNNLKVVIPLSDDMKNFDRISFIASLSHLDVSAFIDFNGTEAITNLLKQDKYEAWIVNPTTKKGDFNYADAKISMADLCEYPREKLKKEITVTVKARGYNITGTETKWNDYYEKWETVKVYGEGTLLSSGTMVIEQLPPETSYTDPENFIKIGKIEPEKTRIQETEGVVSVEVKRRSIWINVRDQKDDNYKQTYIDIYIVDDKDIINSSEYKNSGATCSAYEFIKEDIVAWLGYYSDQEKQGGIAESDFEWRKFFELDNYCIPSLKPGGEEKAKGSKVKLGDLAKMAQGYTPSSTKAKFANSSVWKKETLGSNEFEVLKFEDAYHTLSDVEYGKIKSDAEPGVMLIYIIYKSPYTYIINPKFKSVNQGNELVPYDKAYQLDLVTKTVATLEILK